MSVIFYDHLINKEEVIILINKSDDPDNLKGKAIQLIDDIIHQGIIEFILQKLNPSHHGKFLNHLHSAPYDPEIITYLRQEIGDDVEEQITIYSKKIITEIKKDLSI